MRSDNGRQAASFMDLGSRLIGEFSRLLDQHLELLKAELKQGASEAFRHLGLVVGGVAGAGIGLVCLLLAIGIWIGDLIGSRSGGLAITGAVLLLLGSGIALAGVRSLGNQQIVPESVRELRRDAEWIRNEV
jgi:uncharacterized membrane protein YqjE